MKKIIVLFIVLLLLTGCTNSVQVDPAQDGGSPGSVIAEDQPAAPAEEQEPAPVPEDAQAEDDLGTVTTPVLLRGALVGGLIRGEWLDADAFYQSGAVDFDGYRYTAYSDGICEGQAKGGPFVDFFTGEPVGQDGDIYNSYASLVGGDQAEMYAAIALSADALWGVFPRAYTKQSNDSAEYQTLVENMLVQEGLADPVTDLRQVITVDLDGDGTDEVLLVADNTQINEGAGPGKGDNAILVFRRMNGDQPIDQTVDSYVAEDAQPVMRIHIGVKTCADLDGDGCMEVIAERSDGAMSVTCIVYKLIDGQLVQVASNGLGWGSGEYADPGGAQ